MHLVGRRAWSWTDFVRAQRISSRAHDSRQRTHRRALRIVIAILGAAAAAVFGGRAARAQVTGSGFAVNRFEPAGSGSDWFSLESLDFRGHARPAFGVVVDGAWKPLVAYDQSGQPIA